MSQLCYEIVTNFFFFVVPDPETMATNSPNARHLVNQSRVNRQQWEERAYTAKKRQKIDRTENLIIEWFQSRIQDHGPNANTLAFFTADHGQADVFGGILAEFLLWCLFYR